MITRNDERMFKDMVTSDIPDSILHSAINWIKDNLNPDDVFEDDKLEEWAKENGFVEDNQ
jgi:hypothetical protein